MKLSRYQSTPKAYMMASKTPIILTARIICDQMKTYFSQPHLKRLSCRAYQSPSRLWLEYLYAFELRLLIALHIYRISTSVLLQMRLFLQ
jgi:hypothetical protein